MPEQTLSYTHTHTQTYTEKIGMFVFFKCMETKELVLGEDHDI